MKRINHKDFGLDSLIIEPRVIPERKRIREMAQENSRRALYAAERHNHRLSKER
jgi:hypothetical protein